MKKYFIGILAVVLAVGFSSFTKAPNFSNRYFKLRIVPTQQSDLSVLQNWEEVSTDEGCVSNTDQEACIITVDQDDRTNEGGSLSYFRPTNVTITPATYGFAGTFYVASIAADAGHDAATKVNKVAE